MLSRTMTRLHDSRRGAGTASFSGGDPSRPIRSMRIEVTASPRANASVATVVSAGERWAESSESSKPVIERSSGTRNPRLRARDSPAIAMMSLA